MSIQNLPSLEELAAIRPEFQDRQSSSIKAGSVDWRITRLVEDYS
jgi:hypothetical protein